MAINAYQVLYKYLPVTMDKLVTNLSVCDALQAVFTYVASLAADDGKNATGIKGHISVVGDKYREDGYLRATLQIDFTFDEQAAPIVKVDKKILWQRNLVIARVMEVNPNIRNLAKDVVVALEQLGAQYKLPWEDLRCASKRVLVRRGGHRLEMDVGQKEWLPDDGLTEEETAAQVTNDNSSV